MLRYKYKCPICESSKISVIETIITELEIDSHMGTSHKSIETNRIEEYTCNKCRHTDRNLEVFIEEVERESLQTT